MRIRKLFVIVVVLVFVIMVMLIRHKDNVNIVDYVEEILKVEIEQYVEEAIGGVDRKYKEEDFSHIRLKIKYDMKKEFIEYISGHLGEVCDIQLYTNLNISHELYDEMSSQEVKYVFLEFLPGKRAITRYIYIYVTEDEQQNMYVYIFG